MTNRTQTDDDGAIILPAHECWDLLSSVTLGRLVTSVDGRPQIFPVNYAVQRRTILFRTAEGTKLVSTAINNEVVFEVDDHNVAEGWSVIVRAPRAFFVATRRSRMPNVPRCCRGRLLRSRITHPYLHGAGGDHQEMVLLGFDPLR